MRLPLPPGIAAFLPLATATVHAAEPETVEVRPTETGELFANPGRGWQTFHEFVVQDG